MSQKEVINCLKKSKKPLSSNEIYEFLGADKNNKKIFLSLSKLVKHNEINFKELDRFQAEKKYGIKKRNE